MKPLKEVIAGIKARKEQQATTLPRKRSMVTWYVTPGRYGNPCKNSRVWTLSENPDWAGWQTDNGSEGYGLTYEQAKELADAANSVKQLKVRLRNMERVMAAHGGKE